MNISKKIGLSLTATLFLSIVLGALSIYSLKLTYKNMEEVLDEDIPVIRLIGGVELSFASAVNSAISYIITDDKRLKSSYDEAVSLCEADLKKIKQFADDKDISVNLDMVTHSYYEITDMISRLMVSSGELDKKLQDSVSSAESIKKIVSDMIAGKDNRFRGRKEILVLQSEYIPAVMLLKRLENLILKYITNLRLLVLTGNTWYQDEIFSIQKDIDAILLRYGNEYAGDEDKELFVKLKGDYEILIAVTEVLNRKFNYKNELLASLFISADDFTGLLADIFSYKRMRLFKRSGLTAMLSEYIFTADALISLGVDSNRFLPYLSRILFSHKKEYADAYYGLFERMQAGFNDYKKHIVDQRQKDNVEALLKVSGVMEKKSEDILGKNMRFLQDIKLLLKSMQDIDGITGSHLDMFINELRQQLDPDLFYSKYLSVIDLLQEITLLNNEIRLAVFDYIYTGNEESYNDYTNLYFTIRSQIKNYERKYAPSGRIGDIKKIEEDLDIINDTVVKMNDMSLPQVKAGFLESFFLTVQWNSLVHKSIDAEYDSINKSRKVMVKKQKIVNIITICIILLIIAISVFIAFYTSENITLPIRKFTEGAREIASGKLNIRLHIRTGDELEELASEFNKMAKELSSLYKNLERKVIERTVELAETNRVLEDANKELDDFTYVVSHDLKEPLRGVIAFSNFLQEEYAGKLDDKANEYLDIIVSSANRMSSLISDLLNLSRLARTKNPYEEVDLGVVLAEIKESLRFAITEKKADIFVGELPQIVCDRVRISEVFFNLISNAMKFVDKDRHPAVKIGCEDEVEYYKFFVSDNGIGIADEDKDKIFQIFKRLHTRDKYEGTGAGLTIVKKIVESHGGYIWVESREGKGTTFYFTIRKNLKTADSLSA